MTASQTTERRTEWLTNHATDRLRKRSLSNSEITSALDWYWKKARKIQDKPPPGHHSKQAKARR